MGLNPTTMGPWPELKSRVGFSTSWTIQGPPHFFVFLRNSPLVQTTVRKDPRLGGLNNRHLFLTILESGSPRLSFQQIQHLLRILFLVCRWQSAGCILTWRRKRGLWSLPLLIKALIQSSALVMSSNPKYLPKVPLPNMVTVEMGSQHMTLRGYKHSLHTNK